MGEIVKFPSSVNKNEEKKRNGEEGERSQVLQFENKSFQTGGARAFLSRSHPFVAEGNEIIVEIQGKKYIGIVTSIVSRDSSNNVTKVSYSIPFLHGDDPFKFGSADFIYTIETHD